MHEAPHHRHRREGPSSVCAFVVTSSRSRTPEDDEGGQLVEALLEGAGHAVVGRRIVPDDAEALRRIAATEAREAGAEVLLITGGTGLSPHDRTIEALEPLWTKRLDGFGELFRQLSFAEVGPAAMLSRAAGGAVGPLLVFALPGSPAAVRLALERLILPELGHAVGLLAPRG